MKARIVRTKAGYCFYVMGERGLLRSVLPVREKAAAERRLAEEYPEAKLDRSLLPELAGALQDYFAGKPARFSVKLDESGLTEFQRSVYKALRRVRSGKTISYKELAEKAGRPRAARGVGVCMRRNPFPPIVPCHRVLGSSGKLTGFSAEEGIEQKRAMLAMEGVEGFSGA